MEDGLRAVRRLDDDVGLRERLLDVAALVVRAASRGELLAADRLVGVEHDLELLPLDVDRVDRGLRLAERVGGDRGDGRAGVADLLLESVRVARPERRAHARQRERGREVDPLHARVRERRAENRRLQHPGQLDVGGVARLAAHALRPVDLRVAGRPTTSRGPSGHCSSGSSSTTIQTSSNRPSTSFSVRISLAT